MHWPVDVGQDQGVQLSIGNRDGGISVGVLPMEKIRPRRGLFHFQILDEIISAPQPTGCGDGKKSER
jgi:hypothetical protein